MSTQTAYRDFTDRLRFNSITDGWMEYSHNLALVRLLSHAMAASESAHLMALGDIEEDIRALKDQKRNL